MTIRPEMMCRPPGEPQGRRDLGLACRTSCPPSDERARPSPVPSTPWRHPAIAGRVSGTAPARTRVRPRCRRHPRKPSSTSRVGRREPQRVVPRRAVAPAHLAQQEACPQVARPARPAPRRPRRPPGPRRRRRPGSSGACACSTSRYSSARMPAVSPSSSGARFSVTIVPCARAAQRVAQARHQQVRQHGGVPGARPEHDPVGRLDRRDRLGARGRVGRVQPDLRDASRWSPRPRSARRRRRGARRASTTSASIGSGTPPSAAPARARPAAGPPSRGPRPVSPEQLPQRDDQQVADRVLVEVPRRARTGAAARRATCGPSRSRRTARRAPSAGPRAAARRARRAAGPTSRRRPRP